MAKNRKRDAQSVVPRARGCAAARLRQRKFTLIERFDLPDDLLPGSFVRTSTRCGKQTCHCAEGEGHPTWTWTFMVEGRKRVERIPAEWVAEVEARVHAGRAFQDALREVLAANAQLLILARQQTRRRRARG
jgi:hypothetical protein